MLESEALYVANATRPARGGVDCFHPETEGIQHAQPQRARPKRTRASRRASAIRPFHVNVPEIELSELRGRINATKWPEQETVADESQGAWNLGNTYLKPGFRRGNSSILYWFYTATLAEMRRSCLPRIKHGPEVFVDDAAVRRGMHETIE